MSESTSLMQRSDIEPLEPAAVIEAEVQRSLAAIAKDVMVTGGIVEIAEPGTEPTRSVDSNVIKLPRLKPAEWKPTEFFAAVQEWDGWVTEVGDDSFSADLRDVTADDDDITEVAEIPFEELSASQRASLREGLKFRWLIGYSKTRGFGFGKKQVIYFRPFISTPAAEDELSDTVSRLRERVAELPKFEL